MDNKMAAEDDCEYVPQRKRKSAGGGGSKRQCLPSQPLPPHQAIESPLPIENAVLEEDNAGKLEAPTSP